MFMTKARKKVATLLVLSLLISLLLAAPAYASAADEAEQSAYDVYDWLWCATGYEDYC